MSFQKLVRFEHDGQVSYGDLLEASSDGFKVKPLNGTAGAGFTLTDKEPILVKNILCPLESTPIVYCIGVNYHQHATEANITVPQYPVTFAKPADSLAGPFEDVNIHPDAQAMMDYEGELCVVIGRDVKDIPESEALDCVLGYTVGNDISARTFQLKDVSGGQYGYSKSFDKFAPIGPAIWSPQQIPDPQNLQLTTRVNGELRQSTSTKDMIWSVRQIIAHLSRGRTLRSGTVIMTGTPSGVGYFQKRFLSNGDIVEVEIEGWGKVANKMVF